MMICSCAHEILTQQRVEQQRHCDGTDRMEPQYGDSDGFSYSTKDKLSETSIYHSISLSLPAHSSG